MEILEGQSDGWRCVDKEQEDQHTWRTISSDGKALYSTSASRFTHQGLVCPTSSAQDNDHRRRRWKNMFGLDFLVHVRLLFRFRPIHLICDLSGGRMRIRYL